MAVDDMTTSAHWNRLWNAKCDWTWGAADGAQSRLAPNGHTYWCWGDTIIGLPNPADISFDSERVLISNSIVVQRGAETSPATFGNGSAAVPDTVMGAFTRRFWTTDILFPTDTPSKCYVLCQRIHDDIVLGFIPDGAYIAEFDVTPIGMLRYTGRLYETPTTPTDVDTPLEIQWCQTWEEKGGYVYVYGFNSPGVISPYVTPARTYVARVPVRSLTNKNAWQIWTGTGWVAGLTDTALASAKRRAAPILDGQLTSARYQPSNTRWLFANKPNHGFGATVQIHASADPQGPLVIKQTVASAGGTSPGGNAYVTYNPTLHPTIPLASGNVLLAISHNGDFTDIFDERNLYKPDWQEVVIPL